MIWKYLYKHYVPLQWSLVFLTVNILGNATLHTRLGFQWGIGALGAQPEHKASVAMGGPTSRYHMWLVDVDYRNHLLWVIDLHPLPLHSMDSGFKVVKDCIA